MKQMKCEQNVPLENALDLTGFGKYNWLLLSISSMAMLAMALDLFGMSFVVPASTCDLDLTIEQKGLLTSIPTLGLVFMCYPWGYISDTKGRRPVLLIGMSLGFIFSVAASFSPNMPTIAVLKFLSVAFSSAANSVTYTMMGEFQPQKYRDGMILYMNTGLMLTGAAQSVIAIPILGMMQFRYPMSLLGIDFTPWRLYMIVLAIPLILTTVLLLFSHETPKFLMAKGKHDRALYVLRKIYALNTGNKEDDYPVTSLLFEEKYTTEKKILTIKTLWNQFIPIFKKPFLKYSFMLYYIQFWTYFVATMLYSWVPFIGDLFFDEIAKGKSDYSNLCTVITTAIKNTSSAVQEVPNDCSASLSLETSSVIAITSVICSVINLILAYAVRFTGKKYLLIAIFFITAACGVIINNVFNPLVGLGLYFIISFVSLVFGIIAIYAVDLFPTYIRGMAVCLAIMTGRIGGAVGINVFGYVANNYCSELMYFCSASIFSCLLFSLFLPYAKSESTVEKQVHKI